MSWVIYTHSALLFCGQIQAYLVRIRLSLASAGLHLACWKSDDWVRLVTLPMPNFRGNSWMPMLCQCCVIAMSEWEVLRASAQPPLCEHDVSYILGLRWDHRESSSSSKARNLQKVGGCFGDSAARSNAPMGEGAVKWWQSQPVQFPPDVTWNSRSGHSFNMSQSSQIF